MVPLSGGSAQNGRDILNGFLLYLDEIGYRAGGRQIQLIVEDDEAIPAVGLTKARKLVERDEVHVMAGALLSSTGTRWRRTSTRCRSRWSTRWSRPTT